MAHSAIAHCSMVILVVSTANWGGKCSNIGFTGGNGRVWLIIVRQPVLWIWAKYCDINSALPTVVPKKKNAEIWIENTYTNDILIPVGLPPNGMIRPVLALLTHAHLVACVAGRDRELPFLTFAEAGGVEAGIEEVLE